MTKEGINELVIELCNKYNTTNPYDLAEKLGFLVREDDLGASKGYYMKAYGSVFLVINHWLEEYVKLFTVSHELGHAIMHEGLSYCFLKTCTYHSGSKYEREADIFAIRLLMQNYDNVFDLGHIANLLGVREEFILNRFE